MPVQKCLADIKWLHQLYVLEGNGNAICFLEFIAEVKKGSLDYFELYLPYQITKLKNRTSSLLDEKNIYYYADKNYKLLSIDLL